MTVVTSQEIYQSSDYRLSIGGKGTTDQSTKMVHIQFFDWHAVISYTGIGSINGKDTSYFLMNWLSGRADLTLSDVIKIIQERGSNWLKSIRPPFGRGYRYYRHTFVLAGFFHGKPSVSVISNFEDITGQSWQPEPNLRVTTKSKGRFPWILVSGQKHAVDRASRRMLENSARRNPYEAQRVRNALRKINLIAAKAPSSNHAVSTECGVITIRADNRGELSPTGLVKVHTLVNGSSFDIDSIIKLLGLKAGPVRSVGFRSTMAAIPYPDCPKHVINPAPKSGIMIKDLDLDGWTSHRVMSVNREGTMLGDHVPVSDLSRHYIWLAGDEKRLPNLPKIRARCAAINDVQQIALTIEHEGGGLQAALVDAGGIVKLLDLAGYQYSEARGISNDGVVIGIVGEGDSKKTVPRPAAWLNEGIKVLRHHDFDQGHVAGIGASGEVLVAGYKDHTPTAYIWRPQTDEIVQVGEKGVFPIGMSSNGFVMGKAKSENGFDLCVVAKPQSKWIPIAPEPRFVGCAINSAGDIAGFISIDGENQPALRRASGEYFHLPYFRYHHCVPSALNEDCRIVGNAWASHGQHALVWDIESRLT